MIYSIFDKKSWDPEFIIAVRKAISEYQILGHLTCRHKFRMTDKLEKKNNNA